MDDECGKLDDDECGMDDWFFLFIDDDCGNKFWGVVVVVVFIGSNCSCGFFFFGFCLKEVCMMLWMLVDDCWFLKLVCVGIIIFSCL